MGYSDPPSVFSRGGSLIPSITADARCIDDVIVSKAMINHACNPNCSKFAPRKQAKAGAVVHDSGSGSSGGGSSVGNAGGGSGGGGSGGGGGGKSDGGDAAGDGAGAAAAASAGGGSRDAPTNARATSARFGSEIVACCDIKANTEICIHYSTVVERGYHTRDRTFREQHYMPLDPSPYADDVDGKLKDAQKKLATELDTALDEFESGQYGGTKGLAYATASARLQKAAGYRAQAEEGLPAKHLVATRTHAVVVREVHLVLAASSNAAGGAYTAEAGSVAIVGLRSVVLLRARLAEYLAPNHHACATAAGDESTLLSFLLSNDPELLYATFPDTLPSFSKASRAEYAARKVHKKLKKLYE